MKKRKLEQQLDLLKAELQRKNTEHAGLVGEYQAATQRHNEVVREFQEKLSNECNISIERHQAIIKLSNDLTNIGKTQRSIGYVLDEALRTVKARINKRGLNHEDFDYLIQLKRKLQEANWNLETFENSTNEYLGL